MRKLYEKPEMIFESFFTDEIMVDPQATVSPSGIAVFDTLNPADGIVINYANGNKLNSINYADFIK